MIDEKIDFIPTKLYNEIAMVLPIASVEAVIEINNELLVLQRTNEPAKGEWWFPGGRIKRGESFEVALRREVKEETGLEIIEYEFLNVYSRVFPQRHDITIAFRCRCKNSQIKINEEHERFALTRDLKQLHPFIKEVIEDWKKSRLRRRT